MSTTNRKHRKKRSISANTRKKDVCSAQINRMRELTEQKKSTNEIQKTLSKEGLGLRRTVMLRYIREFREKQPQANASKFTPRKYRKAKKPKRQRGATYQGYQKSYRRSHRKPESLTQRFVAVYGTVFGEHRRIQVSGHGKELYEVMVLIGGRHGRPPKHEFKFLEIDANKLLADPDKYLIHGTWDSKPRFEYD